MTTAWVAWAAWISNLTGVAKSEVQYLRPAIGGMQGLPASPFPGISRCGQRAPSQCRRAVADEIYSILTARTTETIGVQRQAHGGLAQLLPSISTNRIGVFVKTLAAPPTAGIPTWPRLIIDSCAARSASISSHRK
jgi:hypothetical protein